MQTVAIVDFNFGNLRSVHNALRTLAGSKFDIRIASDAQLVEEADRVVFPGQGAARQCMRSLGEKNLLEAIAHAAQTRPFLGICMGMQVLMEHSEENAGVDGLGLFSGTVRPFASTSPADQRLKIPHMGWNGIAQHLHPLWHGIPDESRFYFVHSYYVAPEDTDRVVGQTLYGLPFAAAIAQGPAFAIQAHLEKSGRHGLQLLRNFLDWDGHA